VVNLLIENKADINKDTTSDGYTPLIIAVNRGHKNIAKTLIEMNANLDCCDLSSANTALHMACTHGHLEIVEMLATEATFSQIFNKENKQGQKAIDVAQEKVIEL
jgi:ankyrin repeat protein